MSKTETEVKSSAKAPKPKLSDAQKVELAQSNLKDAIVKQIENEEKSANSKFLGGVAKSAIKSFEGGKKFDWSKSSVDLIIFTREPNPTLEQVETALTDLSRYALMKKAEHDKKEASKGNDSEESTSESEDTES